MTSHHNQLTTYTSPPVFGCFHPQPCFKGVTKAMRTLIDLLNTEHGYARIFFDQDGYSYELYAYRPRPVADLFARMVGYPSAADACEAAQHQLSAVHPEHRPRTRKAHRPQTRRTRPQAAQLMICALEPDCLAGE
jgi:hypothetical protein